MEDYSDAPGPLTWVYPFREYHEMVFGASPDVPPVFFGDWFLRNAVNAGFPLNTVVSTDNFLASLKVNPSFYRDTILLTPVPASGGALERTLIERLRRGTKCVSLWAHDSRKPGAPGSTESESCRAAFR